MGFEWCKAWRRRRAIVLSVIVCPVIVWSCYAFAYLPQQNRRAALVAQCAMVSQHKQQLEAFARRHPAADADLRELARQKAAVDALLPDALEARTVFSDLAQAAEASKVRLGRIVFGAAINKNGYQELPVEVTVKGDYFSIIGFVHSIEENSRMNTIHKITMKREAQELDGVISLVTYVFCPNAVEKPKP